MILYIEQQARNHPQTHRIMSHFSHAEVVYIKHYKNIFDKRLSYKTKDCLIIARQTGRVMLPVPASYGYGTQSFFLRTSLNCVFDCEYCYLKGAFRNDFPVFFVNYDEIKERIVETLEEQRNQGVKGNIWIYPSNWTDLLGSEHIASFHHQFLSFFDTLVGVQVESRTKSTAVRQLLSLPAPVNTEIAYSLNPQIIINNHETGTPPLKKRFAAINKLLDAGWRVGLRLMPLIPVDNYIHVYDSFFEEIKYEIDIDRCSSLFFGGFLLTKKDFSVMTKKNPQGMLWKHLTESDDSKILRTSYHIREELYGLCMKHFPTAQVSFDEI